MIIRIGYVSQSLHLWEATPASTVTLSRWKAYSPAERKDKLHQAVEKNLTNTIRMLHYNAAQEIKLFRFSSALVPLATHKEAAWDYITPFTDLYKEIGTLVKKHDIRPSFHPNQFTLFTSDKPEVTENAVKDMEYHYEMMKAMGIEKDTYINLHVGGAYGNKSAAVERFHENLKSLPAPIKKQMTLENDDKTYTTSEVLDICEKEDIPLMFDYHHFAANHSDEEELSSLLPRFFKTWDQTGLPPKIHASSPKTEKEFRSHADYVDAAFLEPMMKELRKLNTSVDFMVEAKAKDLAALKLTEDLAAARGIKRTAAAVLQL